MPPPLLRGAEALCFYVIRPSMWSCLTACMHLSVMFPWYLMDFLQTFFSIAQCWANPNRDWDLNRDLNIFGNDSTIFGSDLTRKIGIRFDSLIFWDSIWGARFNSRILASCWSTVESLLLRLEMLRQQNAVLSSWLTDSNTFYQISTLASFIRNFVLDFLKLKLPWLSKYWLSGLTVLTTNFGIGIWLGFGVLRLEFVGQIWDWDLDFGLGIWDLSFKDLGF